MEKIWVQGKDVMHRNNNFCKWNALTFFKGTQYSMRSKDYSKEKNRSEDLDFVIGKSLRGPQRQSVKKSGSARICGQNV